MEPSADIGLRLSLGVQDDDLGLTWRHEDLGHGLFMVSSLDKSLDVPSRTLRRFVVQSCIESISLTWYLVRLSSLSCSRTSELAGHWVMCGVCRHGLTLIFAVRPSHYAPASSALQGSSCCFKLPRSGSLLAILPIRDVQWPAAYRWWGPCDAQTGASVSSFLDVGLTAESGTLALAESWHQRVRSDRRVLYLPR